MNDPEPRKIEISVNSPFKHDISMSVGLPIDAQTFHPDAVSMVHLDGEGGQADTEPMEIIATLVEARTGTLNIKRLGTYPSGGQFEVRISRDVLLPEYRPLFGGVIFRAPGSGST